VKGGKMPTDAKVDALTKRLDAEEEADTRAHKLPPYVRPDFSAIAQAVYAAHSAILKTLKDPDSAEFNSRDGEAYSLNEDGSPYAVCGEVNAKNSFGGYTGEKVWIAVMPKQKFYTEETGITHAMFQQDCTGAVHHAEPTRHSRS
jgi:hypothetical protein